MEAENIGWEDPWLQSLDLEYHNLDPERGLYRALEQEGQVLELFKGSEIESAIETPPVGTRAWIRGQMVKYYGNDIQSIHWTGIKLKDGNVLDLTSVIKSAEVDTWINDNKEQWQWK